MEPGRNDFGMNAEVAVPRQSSIDKHPVAVVPRGIVQTDRDSRRPGQQRWRIRGTSPAARTMAAELGMTATLAEALLCLGHSESAVCRRFLEPKLSDLQSPDKMIDRRPLATRLAHAIRNQERICVFGDYDCDGITSAAILAQACVRLGGNVTVELASRFDGGYGLGAAALERILAHSPGVVVTCDCGSSDHVSLGELGRRGIDCLVIDHHLVPEQPLPAMAFLNPHRPECGYPFKGLASCGLALSVVGELRAQLGADFDLRTCLDLVAIGTIADVAPLVGDNRALVRAGLRSLSQPRRPGLRALMRRVRFEPGASVTAEDVAFRIAPRLNAPGRLSSPLPALRLLLAESDVEAEAIADEIELLQTERRRLQAAMVEQAEEQILQQGWEGNGALVVGSPSYNVGIVGIVAGKLADRHGCPVVVYGMEGGTARGSVRGPNGAPLFDMVRDVSDCLLRFGGHHAAAGLELEPSRIDEFRERFVQAARMRMQGSSGVDELKEVLLLDSEDDGMRVARELLLLEPCGEGNRAPLIGVTGRLAVARELRGGHLRLELQREGGQMIGGFCPNQGERAASLPNSLLAVGQLRISTFGGTERAELLVTDMVPHPAESSRAVAGSTSLGASP